MEKFSTFGIVLLNCMLISTARPNENPTSVIGALGGVLAKSKKSHEFYFISPYSLQYIGAVYSFSDIRKLIQNLPKVGQPVYWENYRDSKHLKLIEDRNLELMPLNESELKMVESACHGGAKCFPRSEGERHPALPIPPKGEFVSP